MSLWAEAWDLPHLATPGKKVAYVPVLDARFGRHADAFREEGSMSIPVAWDRLDEVLHIDTADHSNDVGSVIHLFQRNALTSGPDPKPRVVGSFVAERRPDALTSEAVSETQISGRGLTSYFLDRVKLWSYDYPANPTKEDDWIFGGENILSNPGLEDGDLLSAEWVVWLDEDVASGTWRIDIGGDVTDPFDWDVTNGDIQTEVIDAIPGLIGLSVSGTGTEDDPWVLTVTDPAGEAFPTFQAIDIDLGPGSNTIHANTIHNGGTGREITGWEKSQNLDRGGREHGRYASDGFRLTQGAEPVHTGAYALRINGLSRYAGAQQRVNVIAGHRYTASVWARTTSATNIFRFVIRDKYDGFIGGPMGLGGVTMTPDTWTLFTYTFVAPTDMIIMRFAVVGDTVDGEDVNPLPFYIDDGSLAPGVPAATLGDILLQMLLDAGVDHFAEAGRNALLFLVPTFDAALDSGGVAWDAVRSVTLNAGDSYGQIIEAFQRLWRYVVRIRFDRDSNTYYLDAFNPGYVELDHETTDTGTLMVGMNILGGEVIRRAPDATAFRALTDEGEWQEDVDTDLQTAWGWADAPPLKVASVWDELPDILDAQMFVNRDQMITVEVEMTNQGQVVPLQHVDVFHRIKVNLGGKSSIVPEYLMVTSIVTSFKPGDRPSYQVFVNSDAFASTGAAALAEAVRRLLRKGQRNLKNFGGSALGGGIGGDPTIFVAAFDASQQSKDLAHYVVQDDSDATEALDAAQGDLEAIFPVQGRLVISEGHFNIPGLYVFGHSGGEGVDPLVFDVHGLGEGRSYIVSTTQPTGSQIALDFKGFCDHATVDQTYEGGT